eukprot:TRINITY_DN3627_c0_g1_i1.p1 TRINITY_DN3627_c0_g1~~TRINITY_DN3627_c0_g1_i1.p1  ORF type:complete len:706 (-),score=99.15 TRINITY_DN3627_c0_g1_i1:1812-3929(-)
MKNRFAKEQIEKDLHKHIQHISHLAQSIALFRQRVDSGSKFPAQSSVIDEDLFGQFPFQLLCRVIRELRSKLSALQERVGTLQTRRKTTHRKISDQQQPIIEKVVKKPLSESQEESVPESQMAVGDELCLKADRAFNGHGEVQNFEKAKNLYTEACQMGCSKACGCLAKMFETGTGVEKNLTEAFALYKQGAYLGDPGCMFAIGKYFEKNIVPEHEPNRGMEDAVSYYERAAGEGHPEALTKLGYMHEQGIYYQKDIGRAIEYYTKAAQRGDFLAINYLGLHYYKMAQSADESVRRKYYQKAAELFKKSKELGCARAANNLGMCYEQGTGVEKDLDQAFACYKEAANKKYAQGMFNLAYMYLAKAKITRLMENYEKAAHWLRVAINEDPKLADAFFYLGFLFEKGLGVDYDFQTAFSYYRKAALLNHAKAAKKCGDLLATGHGLVQPNKIEALKYYNKALELGDPEAYAATAKIYEEGGEGVTKNEEAAYQYYEKARELGYPEASVNLSYMYNNGVFVEKDTEKAKELLIEAANKGSYNARDYLISNGIIASIHQDEEISEIQKENSVGPFTSKKQTRMEQASEIESRYEGQTFGKPVMKKEREAFSAALEPKLQPFARDTEGDEDMLQLKKFAEEKVDFSGRKEEDEVREKLSLPDFSPGPSPLVAKQVEEDVKVQPAQAQNFATSYSYRQFIAEIQGKVKRQS